jgi:hypothetical protein
MFRVTLRPVNDVGEIECRTGRSGEVWLVVCREDANETPRKETIQQLLTVAEARMLSVALEEAASYTRAY